MDFAIFAIAFNLGKMYRKTENINKNTPKPAKQTQLCVLIFFLELNTNKEAEFTRNDFSNPGIAA